MYKSENESVTQTDLTVFCTIDWPVCLKYSFPKSQMSLNAASLFYGVPVVLPHTYQTDAKIMTFIINAMRAIISSPKTD